jgi:membrane protein
MHMFQRLTTWLQDVARIPWRHAATTLGERFREDRLGLTASSLTFTTTIALVPLITVALAVFTAFPMFAKFQGVLQRWLIESLVPDNIARQVLGYLNQFAGKASKLGVVGVLALFGTAMALILTIDRTLNNIWRVRTPRPFAQRLLIYWTAMTLGPLFLGASLSLTSYAVSISTGFAGVMPGGVSLLLRVLQYAILAAGMAAMFRYVPNTHVRWGHAWIGGLFVSTCMELAKGALALYLATVPTYSVVYGAFATVPILLIWIYVGWVIVLLGAALTAYVPRLLAGLTRERAGPGWQFQLALEVLQQLDIARAQPQKGVAASRLCANLQVDSLRLEPVLEALIAVDWVGRLDELDAQEDEARLVLLVDSAQVTLEPLMHKLLLPVSVASEKIYKKGFSPELRLRDAL